MVARDSCVDCRYCMIACPFGIPAFIHLYKGLRKAAGILPDGINNLPAFFAC